MTENSQAVAATMVGAVIGGLAGYLFFTERGRRLRQDIEPAIEDIARELNSLRATVRKVSAAANEGWSVLAPHQTSPF